MSEGLKSIAWMALPKELKQKAVEAYQEHHKAVFSGDDNQLYEAEQKVSQIDKDIHNALGLDTRFLPKDKDLKTFIADLKGMMKTGYNLFQVEEPDPMMKKIEFHLQKFDIVKSALLKISAEIEQERRR